MSFSIIQFIIAIQLFIIKFVKSGPHDDLIAHYSFNNNLKDLTGNHGDAINLGTSYTYWTPAGINSHFYAATFNAFPQSIQLPTSSVNGLVDYTISAWINSNHASNCNLYSMSNSNADSMTTMALFFRDLSLANEHTSWGHQGFSMNWHSGSANWKHMAIVRDTASKKYTIYLNGTYFLHIDSTIAENSDPLSVEGFVVGQLQNGVILGNYSSPNQFYGSVSDLRIYNKVLSESDIAVVKDSDWCPNQHYVSASGVCSPCTNGCDTCDVTGCINCLTDNFFPNGTVCDQCLPKCLQCTNDSQCTQCQGNNRTSNLPNCECSPGYYDDNVNADCQQCLPGCSGCVNGTECSGCTGIGKQMPICNTCSDGFFDEGNTDCTPCITGCKQCNNISTCQVCLTLGYYKDGGNLCQKCDKNCQSCSGQSNNCDQCTGLNRQTNPPECSCNIGHFSIPTQADCIQCDIMCISCDQPGQCTQCKDNRKPPYCILCEDGFFEDGGECKPCQSTCTTCLSATDTCLECNTKCKFCESQEDNCTVCQYGIGRSLQIPECGCSNGYYLIENQIDCGICEPQCKTCDQIPRKCLECSNSLFQPPLCSKYSYKHTEIQDNSQSSQQKCGIQCKECSNKYDNCLKCTIGFFRLNNLPNCSCQDGYHDQNGLMKNCQKCPSKCLTCSQANTCTSCNQDNNQILVNGNCICKKGYQYVNNNKSKCEKCYKFKGNCLSKCPINTIQNRDTYTCSEHQTGLTGSVTNLSAVCGIIYISILIFMAYLFKKNNIMNRLRVNKT